MWLNRERSKLQMEETEKKGKWEGKDPDPQTLALYSIKLSMINGMINVPSLFYFCQIQINIKYLYQDTQYLASLAKKSLYIHVKLQAVGKKVTSLI